MSIRTKLMMLLLAMLVLILFLALAQGYQRSLARADALFDQHLQARTQLLFAVAPEALPKQQAQFWQRWQGDTLVGGSESLLAKVPPQGLQTINSQGQRLRIATYCRQIDCVVLGEPISERFALSEQLIIALMLPMLLGIALLAVFISLAVKRALQPLTLLSRELKTRAANDFSMLRTEAKASEIKPVVDTLNALLRRTEQAYLRERYFASDAAHELRTPLSAMKINLHNLLQRHNDEDAKALSLSVDRLNHLVEQMLALGRTSSQQWQDKLAKQSLAHICQQLIAELYPQIAQKNLDISLSGECREVIGEPFTLNVMLKNIISNAVKYTPANGRIAIHLADRGDNIELRVADSGPGIASELRERIFDRFFRVGGDSHPAHIPGAGLGLAIVQHVIGLYQGEVQLKQSEWGGLEVIITMAVQRETLCSD
ncbi:sensor histidine kinase [Pseudoalteromonas sp. T1lg10]|uniref:sensor histidine kinase n=1 Tax=Pseudoalteromonas sp. T1lg10 TaxID=2077093 RepID=UPI000CF61A25|nr:Stf0 family sulfotransferase [Pseudoalteromonas sp. T1lg10]